MTRAPLTSHFGNDSERVTRAKQSWHENEGGIDLLVMPSSLNDKLSLW